MTKKICSLWVEKFRPKSIKDVVMPKSFHIFFDKIIKSGDVPNLLLSSSMPGTGKSTVSKALCHDLSSDYIYINASEAGGIDTLRNQIKEFAMTKSFNGKLKIVILDEADGLTPTFQAALRSFIESYASNCRFILTCNYINKIIPALREGRTMTWDFNMSKAEYKDELLSAMKARIIGILKFEKVQYDENSISKIVEALFPSMRKMIALCQKYYDTYGKIDEGIISFKNVGNELVEFIREHKLTEARAYINSNGYSYTDVFKNLFDNLVPIMTKNKSQAIITIAQYEYQCGFSTAPDIQVAAALCELCSLI